MSGRKSARSAANRHRASSPPDTNDNPQSQSQTRRRTRSQSVELGNDSTTVRTKQGRKKSVREDSVESDTSNASDASGAKRSTRTPAINPELSVVVEDEEAEELEDNEEEAVDTNIHNRSQSPGGMSQMSGTTAITSHSAAELQDLDTISVVELLPDLLGSSYRILDLLAPPGASYDKVETVESIMKDLKILGSRRAKRLKHDEEKFKTDREAYGTDNYIQVPLILRKIFGTSDAPIGNFRPDAILQVANLATLIVTLLVTQKESQTSHNNFGDIERQFPEAFISEFDSSIQLGSSRLREESFSIGLELRTQYTILALVHYQGTEGFDPEKILADYFFEATTEPAPDLAYFDDLFLNGHIKDILRAAPNSNDQKVLIKARVDKIREAFRDTLDAVEEGDVVDFEFLDDEFPWIRFISNFVRWTRSRLDEITVSIKKEGGIETIVKSLIDRVKNSDSQADLQYELLPAIIVPGRLLPPANIIAGTPGTSFYDKNNVIALEKMKRGIPPNEDLPSNRIQHRSAKISASSSTSDPSNKRATGSSTAARQMDYNDEFNRIEDTGSESDEQLPQSTAQALAAWDMHNADKNKENRPVPGRGKAPASKPSMFDPQPNATRLEWEEYDSQNVGGPSKRKRDSPGEEEESEESEDGGFESDHRTHNVDRRQQQPMIRQRSPAPVGQRSAKKPRLSPPVDEATDAEQRNRVRAEAVLQRNARGATEEVHDEEVSLLTQARIEAITATQRAKQRNPQPKTRTPWSVRDEQHLVDLIGEHGCSWSLLQKFGEFEREVPDGQVGQVALKDKARNLKMMYLKAQTLLPANFDKIALGKKEIALVRAVNPEYEE